MMRVLSHPFRLAAASALTLLVASAGALAATSPSAYTTKGAWTFQSAPHLHPPKLSVDARGVKARLAPGYLLVANFKNILNSAPSAGQGGPLILDRHLAPVWFRPSASGLYTNNLAVQTYNGKPALSWWQGLIGPTGNTSQGTDVLVDQHYKTLATITAKAPWVITQHEMIVSGHDAWVTANAPRTVPAGSVPGCATCTQIVDSAVQEYDLKTGKLVYSWNAFDHIPLSQAQQPPLGPKAPWDAYHINSIQLISGGHGGRFLTSMRNTSAGYLVDIATSNIIWTVGGKASSFSFANSNATFSWQHDIELHSHGLLSLFDDHCCQMTGNPSDPFVSPTGRSRGLLLRLDMAKHTATYVHQYIYALKGATRYTAFQGNMDLLPNHNVLVGWGSSPFVSEFTYSGKLITEMTFPTPDLTYRGYVSSWVGLPGTDQLRAVAVKRKGKTIVYTSWNGATRVASWRVLGGSSAKRLKIVATALKTGFETALPLGQAHHSYAIEALDGRGHVLAKKAFGSGSGSSGSGGSGSGGSGTGPGGY
jgi:hypothetical protein